MLQTYTKNLLVFIYVVLLKKIANTLLHCCDIQTVQMQQHAERDSALARIEQSRIFLAVALSEYQGKKYKVIEEAQPWWVMF